MILDTDHLSLLLQNHPLIQQKVAQTLPDEIGMTTITAEEQLRGRLNVIRLSIYTSSARMLCVSSAAESPNWNTRSQNFRDLTFS